MRVRGSTVALGLMTVVTAVAAACGGDGDGPPRVDAVVRDSAGVRVVENAGPAWEDADEAWTVSAEPVRTVGVLDGDAAFMLDRVRTPLVRSDGLLVLANGGTSQVRAYRPDGALAWEQGGVGEGPGEYQSISSLLLLPGDSILVWDLRTRRVTFLDPEGALARSYTAQPPENAPMAAPTGVLSGDRLLVSGGVSFSTSSQGQTDEAIWPESPHFVGDREGNLQGRILTIRTTEMRLRQSPQSVSIGDLPFARQGFAIATGNRVVTATSPTPELTWLDLTGVPTQIARWPHEPRAVDDAMVEAWVEERLEENGGPEVAQYYRELVEGVEIPDRVPSFTAVQTDPRGFVWVRQWQDSEGTGAAPWWVFSPDGVLLGEVDVPAGLEVTQITDTQVVGIFRDELGVEQVRVHRLER